MKAGVCWTSKIARSVSLFRKVTVPARRHTGAYITITQNIVDFDSDKASSAARAAWGNSSYKIILKQSAKEFAKYNHCIRTSSSHCSAT